MSEAERKLLDSFAALPANIQNRVLDRIEGAAMVVSEMRVDPSVIELE